MHRRLRHALLIHPILCVTFALGSWLCADGKAWAQRGEAYSQQLPSAPTPTSGFPGIFDANLTDQGRLGVDLPTTGINYGATTNLTVGVYAFSVLPLTLGKPSLVGRLRYRFFGNGHLSSVLDLHAGYTDLSDKGETLTLAPLLLFSNTAWRLGERHEVVLTLMALYLRLAEKDKGALGSANVSVVGLGGVGLSYQFTVARWLVLRATAFSIPIATSSVDSDGGSLEAGKLTDVNFRAALARGLASFRLGNWLLEGGGYVSTGGQFFPWLSVAKNW